MRDAAWPMIAAIIMIFSGLFSGSANATLGADSTTIEKDRAALQASAGVSEQSVTTGVTVHELKNQGVTVKEYEDAAGNIFAVAWRGVAHPDLDVLLGNYHQKYVAAANKRGYVKGERNHKITAQDVVVEKTGHMRDARGKAYLPAMLPAGVTPEDIQW